ncbi:MAG: transposase, partial [Bacillota bacterium]
MEDELFEVLYPLIQQEAKHRPRAPRVQFSDAHILAVAGWAVLHDRPICWACCRRHWHGTRLGMDLPSPATMSVRLRTVSLHLLLEQVFYRVLSVVALAGFCLTRRLDSKPLPVGGFSKDRDARWGYATGGKYKGYKLFACWGRSPTAPEALRLGPMNCSDPAGAWQLIDQLTRRYGGSGGYLLADATHDTNPLHAWAGAGGFQLVAPRKEPRGGLGHRPNPPQRLRSIELLETPIPPASGFGPALYRQRGQIERDYGQMGSF